MVLDLLGPLSSKNDTIKVTMKTNSNSADIKEENARNLNCKIIEIKEKEKVEKKDEKEEDEKENEKNRIKKKDGFYGIITRSIEMDNQVEIEVKAKVRVIAVSHLLLFNPLC